MQIHLSVPEARALKTNLRNSPMTFARNKVKEAQEAQCRCEVMSNNHPAIEKKEIKKQHLHIIGKDR